MRQEGIGSKDGNDESPGGNWKRTREPVLEASVAKSAFPEAALDRESGRMAPTALYLKPQSLLIRLVPRHFSVDQQKTV